MYCKICGKKTDNDVLCNECREEIDNLSTEIIAGKKKINLNFQEHHYVV